MDRRSETGRRRLGLAAVVIMLMAAGCSEKSCSSPTGDSSYSGTLSSSVASGSMASGSMAAVSSAEASAATSTVASPKAAWTIVAAGPTPLGMLPLGPTARNNQPPVPCTPGIPIGISRPVVYEALSADQLLADPRPSGVGEIVNYDWGGHRPVTADSLHITVPGLSWTLRPRAALMRMVVATSDGVCFAQWRVTARPLANYDGAQESGSSWALLGKGSVQTDATVIEGLPEGDWILHVHLAFAPIGATPTHSSESYARVVVGEKLAVQPPTVPAPDPEDGCAGQALQSGLNPDVELVLAGMHASAMGIHGTVSSGYGGALLPAEMPDPPIPTHPGTKITIRTEDGTCGNDSGGFMSMPVPDALAGPYAEDSGLPTNDGADPTASTPQMVRSMVGMAPAPGEWLLTVTFWFGGPALVTYYWRISVT